MASPRDVVALWLWVFLYIFGPRFKAWSLCIYMNLYKYVSMTVINTSCIIVGHLVAGPLGERLSFEDALPFKTLTVAYEEPLASSFKTNNVGMSHCLLR